MKKLRKICICMKDGSKAIWKKKEWDDYLYDGKFFIIMKKGSWIGFYNLDEVWGIEVS